MDILEIMFKVAFNRKKKSLSDSSFTIIFILSNYKFSLSLLTTESQTILFSIYNISTSSHLSNNNNLRQLCIKYIILL